MSARLAGKIAARKALGYGAGGAKQDVLAAHLGIAPSRVARCLSTDPRDPALPDLYLRALGILDVVNAAKTAAPDVSVAARNGQ